MKDKVAKNITQSRAEFTGVQPLQLRGVGRGGVLYSEGPQPCFKTLPVAILKFLIYISIHLNKKPHTLILRLAVQSM